MTVHRVHVGVPAFLGLRPVAGCLPLAIFCGLTAWADDSPLAAVRAAETARVDVLDHCSRAIVCIFADSTRSGGGSGVVISPEGYGLTNYHVVQEFIESRRGVGGLSDGHLYPLRVLGIDPGGDIAMFKLEGRERFDFAPLGDSDALRVGQFVVALGNPFLTAEDYRPTITLGIISGLHRYQVGVGNALEYADCIQVSTSINPGNSGGPLVDMQGRVIGINGRASFEERGRVNVGASYAVSINQIKRFLPGLTAGRLMEHGTLGITVRMVGDDVVINAIQDLSPAERAGFQLGDHVLEVAGRAIRTPNDFNNVVAIYPAGWPVSVRARRDGKDIKEVVRLDRLALRVVRVYLLDLEHNHAEIARLLRRIHPDHGGDPARAPRTLRWTGRVVHRDADGERVATVRIQQSPHEDRLTRLDGADVDPTDPLWREWRWMTAPLLGVYKLDVDWEFVGGDEVNGCIVHVVERRAPDKSRIRWGFSVATDELLQVTVDRGDGDEPTVWTMGDCDLRSELPCFPRHWARREPGGTIVTIEIDSTELVANDDGAAETRP